MNYLCMTWQKQVVMNENFVSREMAENLFWQRFGGFLEEKLEEEKRKLENRIRYYERRAEKHSESLEITEICDIQRKAAQEELEQINRQLNSGNGGYKNYYYGEKYDISEQPIFGEAELVLHLAGILHIGDIYRVTEEKYYCTKLKISSEEGILEVRELIPKSMLVGSISLEICQENSETAVRLNQNIKKMAAQTRRDFISRIEHRQRCR